jgi:hypothetical protein
MMKMIYFGALLRFLHQINAPQRGESQLSTTLPAPKRPEIPPIAQFWRTNVKLASQLLRFQQPNF